MQANGFLIITLLDYYVLQNANFISAELGLCFFSAFSLRWERAISSQEIYTALS